MIYDRKIHYKPHFVKDQLFSRDKSLTNPFSPFQHERDGLGRLNKVVGKSFLSKKIEVIPQMDEVWEDDDQDASQTIQERSSFSFLFYKKI